MRLIESNKVIPLVRLILMNHPKADAICENMQKLVDIHTIEAKPQWIPVTERLPEKSGNYIVCCDDSWCPDGEGIWYRENVVITAEYYKGSWTWYESGTEWSLENIVTHWMPLPESPKDGGATHER